MPQIFKIGAYLVFIWVNEGNPIEPIHVHISEKRPEGKCLLANNNSNIPQSTLRGILRIIETRSFEIISRWKETFGEISFFC